jgi:NADH:ubiquinone oxidoreductase subunit 6 (subunit J)
MALSLKDLLSQNEFWALVFVFGWVSLNWPMLTLAANATILGVPAILVYLGTVWVLIILALFIFDRVSGR